MKTIRIRVLAVAVTIALLSSLSSQQSGDKITCEAPSVKKGDPTNVTCHFTVDASTVRPVTVSVDLYPPGNAGEIRALDCTWRDQGTMSCTKDPRFSFNAEEIGRELVLNIPAASEEFIGRYVCNMMSRKAGTPDFDFEPCTFNFAGDPPIGVPTTTTTTTSTTTTTKVPTVSDDVTTTEMPSDNTKTPGPKAAEGGMGGGAIAGVVVAVVVVVAIIAVVVVILLRRRDMLPGMCRRSDTTTHDADAELPGYQAQDNKPDETHPLQPEGDNSTAGRRASSPQQEGLPKGDGEAGTSGDNDQDALLPTTAEDHKDRPAEAASEGNPQRKEEETGTTGDDDLTKPLLSKDTTTPGGDEESSRQEAPSEEGSPQTKEEEAGSAGEDGDRTEEHSQDTAAAPATPEERGEK